MTTHPNRVERITRNKPILEAVRVDLGNVYFKAELRRNHNGQEKVWLVWDAHRGPGTVAAALDDNETRDLGNALLELANRNNP